MNSKRVPGPEPGGSPHRRCSATTELVSPLVERRREVFIYPEASNITSGQFSTYACSIVIGVTIRSGAVRREAEHGSRQFSLGRGCLRGGSRKRSRSFGHVPGAP
jgi:hypothetical protein